MPDGTDHEFRELVHNFLLFSERIQSIRNSLAIGLGLSGVQYTILTAIAHLSGEDGVPVGTVAKHLHVTGSFITMKVAKLVETGLVKKRTDFADRRRVRLTLTDRCVRLLRKVAPIQQPVNDTLFECLSKSDFAMLSRVLIQLVDCAERSQALLRLLQSTSEFRGLSAKL